MVPVMQQCWKLSRFCVQKYVQKTRLVYVVSMNVWKIRIQQEKLITVHYFLLK